MIKKLIAAVVVLSFGVVAQAGNPIIKGVFVNASTGDYLGNVIHVEQDGGDDTTGDGTAAKPYATINKGLSVAVTGDTVLVGPGDYTDTVDVSCKSYGGTYYTIPTVAYINSKKVYLKSREGKSTTFITGKWGADSDGTGEGATRCVYINGSAAKGTVIDGFTIRNGAAPEHEYHASPTDGGGGISGASDVGINNATGKSNAPYGYAVYCTIENCRAAQGAAISCGITAISCLFRGNVAANQNKHVGYRGYNTCNCVFVGNGNGAGHIIAASSASLSINDTYLLNSCDMQIGYGSAGEPSFVYNCAFIGNASNPAAQTGRYATNCVSTAATGAYASSPGGQAGVNRYQVVAPTDEDFTPYTGPNGKLVDAGNADLWSAQVVSWIPSDFADVDFYGNPRVVGDNIDVGAVERQDATVDPYSCFIQLDDKITKVALGETVHQAQSAGEWFAQKTGPTEMYRVSVDLAEGEDIYGYKMSVDGGANVWHYPDPAADKGFWMMPLSALGGKIVTLSAQLAASIKYADPKLADYTGADGSFEKPYETIQEAINDAGTVNWGVVYAKSGTYDKGVTATGGCHDSQDTNSTPNRVYISKNIRVASLEGPEKTIIKGERDESETGAYDGCGPKAVRCVLANQGVYSALQGFTLTGGATDGDLANRGMWDIYPNVEPYISQGLSGKPRFNSSDSFQRGNFAGGGYRCANYDNSARENGVVTDCIISNCVGYIGSAVHGAKVLRSILTKNHYVSHDPGKVDTKNYNYVMYSGVLGGSLVYDNDCGLDLTAVSVADVRYSTIYHPSSTSTSTFSMSSDDARKTNFACPGAPEGDFRVKTGSGAISDAAVSIANAIKYSTGDVYGRPILLSKTGSGSLRGAVQEVFWQLFLGTDVVVSNARPNPGETVTITAAKGRPVESITVGGQKLDISEGKSATYTAPAWDQSVYESSSGANVTLAYDPNPMGWYVDAENGNDANNGWSLATAKKTLVGVMANVLSGDTVYAAPGDYNEGCTTNTATVYKSFMGDGTRHPSRVVIPEGVSLISLEGPEKTTIWGKWHGATRNAGTGPDAIRAVYMMKGTRLEGFTVTHGASLSPNPAGGNDVDERFGGNIMAPIGSDAKPARIVNCIITEGIARSGGAAAGGILERCKIYNNSVNSDGITYGSRLYHCVMYNNGASYLRYHCGVYSCTIWGAGTSGDPDCTVTGTSPIENSIVYFGSSATATTIKYARNCLVHPYESGSKYFRVDNATCSGIVTNTTGSGVVVSETDLHLVADSPAIDAGSNDLLEAYDDGEGDLDGNRRISHGIVDIGAYEFQYKPKAHVTATGGNIEPSEDFEVSIGESETVRATDDERNLLSFEVTTNGVPVELESGTREYTWTPMAEEDTLSVNVTYSTNWYVNAAATDDSGNGFTPETAKKTLRGIMSLAALRVGDTVWAAAGTYNEGMMTNTVNLIGGAAAMPSRVVIPAGVALVATEGPDVTFIEGRPHTDSSKQGADAVRGVYLYNGSRVEGFTIRKCYTVSSSYEAENSCGGCIVAPKMSEAANRANPGRIVNCVLTEALARSGSGGMGGFYERCKFLNLEVNSGGVTMYGTFVNCYFKSAVATKGLNMSLFHSSYGIQSCSIAVSRKVSGDEDFRYVNAPIENSLIYYYGGCEKPTKLLKAKNCVVYATPTCGFTIDSATCSGIITNNTAAAVFDVNGRPVAGSPLIDAGDEALFAAYDDGKGDCEYGQRIYNGALDIGAYEYDWRPEYAKDLVSPDILVTEASPEVVETDGKNVSIPDGATVKLDWPGTGGSYEARFAISGGTLTVTENGKEPVAYTEGGSYVVDAPTADTKLVFTYAGTGSATLLPFLGAYEAKIGTTPYTNFADAYAAVSGSDAITLLKNVTWAPTIDAALKTVSVGKGNFTLTIAPASVTAFNAKGYVCKFDDTTLKVGLPFAGGAGTSETTAWTIPDAETFLIFAQGVAAKTYGVNGAQYFKQTGAVDLDNVPFGGVNGFSGHYDGNGQEVQNLVFSPATYCGLFRTITSSTVKNLTVVLGAGDTLKDKGGKDVATSAFDLSGYNHASPTEFGGAAMAGTVTSTTFTGCTTKGAIACTHNACGFLTKANENTVLVDCTNEVRVVGCYTKVGGFVAICQASGLSLTRCVNKGNVCTAGETMLMDANKAPGCDGVAGFVAFCSDNQVTFTDCANSGVISTTATTANGTTCTNVAGEAVGPLRVGQFFGLQCRGVSVAAGTNRALAGTRLVGAACAFVSATDKSYKLGDMPTFDFAMAESVDGYEVVFPVSVSLGGSYKVMAPLAAYNLQFTKNDVPRENPIRTISFDRSLYAGFEPTVTPAVGVKVTGPAIEGDVLTYTVRRRMGMLMILK